MIVHDKLFIGGRWLEPATESLIEVSSPHDQTLIGRTPQAVRPDVDRAVDTARESFDTGPWSRAAPAERIAVVVRFAELHERRAGELAALVTAENGMPSWVSNVVQAMIAEQSSAYIRAAEQFEWEIRGSGTWGGSTMVRSEPAGVVAAVIPWNQPQQSALTKIVPALLAGCSVVLKPSLETALDGVELGPIFAEAGLPEGVLSIVPADRDVSEYLISRPGVDKIAFTGSTRAGRQIAAIAGQQLKRVSLELGGKSAAIVLADADLAQTLEGLKNASLAGNGEACIAQTRILAPRDRYSEIVEGLGEMVASLRVGDPSDPDTFIGPLVSKAQQDRVEGYIALGEQEGARVVTGGPGGPRDPDLQAGYYVRPTVFADVDNTMRIAREEIFGPVLAVIPYDTVEDAIRIANDSEYGLSGGVWTASEEMGLAIARQIRTGTFAVNGTFGDLNSPFGGFKSSGIGREFGRAGLASYVEQKSIVF
jgi:aldehyde dehydrogenase (NAD+)